MIKKIIKKPLIILGVIICSNTLLAQKKSTEEKIDSLLSLMTLEEKIGQMVQYSASWDVTGPANDSYNQNKLDNLKNGLVGSMLNVTGVKNTREAQRLNMENSRLKIPLLFAYDVIHGYKTIFPVPLGESASWDLEIMELTARVAARESAASGIGWTFSPMIDVSRDARWGRIMEGSGEDPYLTSLIGVAKIKGYQGDDLSHPTSIAACAKHFAGYGFAESGKDYNTVNIGIHELNNSILPPFKAASEAGVATFMNSFNELDGIPATANSYLQRDLLKGEWNFQGLMVSDWGSIAELINHGYAKDKFQAGELALKAGSDMDMEGAIYENSLKELVQNKVIDIKLVDDAVKRILRVKFQLGLFDDPYKYCDEELEKNELYSSENQEVALDAAKKSIVLLKNDKQILPISGDVKSIAVIGPLADDKDSPLGNWRGQAVPNSAVSVLEGIKNHAPKSVKIRYAKGADLSIGERSFLKPMTINQTDTSGFEKAINLAEKSDLVILVVGEDAYQSGEARSQTDIGFAGVQNELIEAIYKANPNVVMVLMNGRPMDLTWSDQHIPAILETWLLGSQHGNAVGEVLFGKYNPSGKLTASFPRNVGQLPLYYNYKQTGRGNEIPDVTYASYRDSKRDALYPFGFGLSYTEFEYGKIKLSQEKFSKGESIQISIDVKNTGKVKGEEVVQMYLQDLFGSVTRPIKELKGFEKITLNPGETKTVTFKIDEKTIEFFTANQKWEAEKGEFKIYIGTNSRDLQNTSCFYQ
ncbi:beta-glucosidase BglX [Moheibacter lacus]|uniref:beta-glucosidase n=1 Tax=Moheibacter lacus TaxID=2745851 RepID=A0A838ZPF1_9FLAO|nr:beta-glucosidase BglX [Moheibacter lacus]MBA5629686.1 beta-glucosidase BglX [Moheibacter lacus]